MSVVTVTDKHGICISYFDGADQLVPFVGFTVEGMAPYVPEDRGPGWVCFEVQPKNRTTAAFFKACAELAKMLFMDLGFTSDQVIELMEDF